MKNNLSQETDRTGRRARFSNYPSVTNISFLLTIDLFTVFSTSDIDKLGKICRHHWKQRLNIVVIAKFESDTY